MSYSNKKKYTKPTVSTHVIDNEISLVMMTFTGGEPPDPPSAAQSDQPTPTQQNNFNENPFGE